MAKVLALVSFWYSGEALFRSRAFPLRYRSIVGRFPPSIKILLPSFYIVIIDFEITLCCNFFTGFGSTGFQTEQTSKSNHQSIVGGEFAAGNKKFDIVLLGEIFKSAADIFISRNTPADN